MTSIMFVKCILSLVVLLFASSAPFCFATADERDFNDTSQLTQPASTSLNLNDHRIYNEPSNQKANHDDANSLHYTNEFAVHIPGGCHADANRLAERYGFVNKGQIGSLDGHYTFIHHSIAKRSPEYSHQHHFTLKSDPEIEWVEQQHVKRRTKRDLINSREDERLNSLFGIATSRLSESAGPTQRNAVKKFNYIAPPSDPLYAQQWYLNHGARGNFDMNVAGAWRLGYTGRGVVVTILDDGIQGVHPDLKRNYDPQASYDINDDDDDPTPQDNGDNKHGTRCAGEVAAEAYNDLCGVGIAFNASIGGVRMLDGTVTDEVEARALSLNPQHVDVYSASWGPEDDGKTVDGPGHLAQRAFRKGILEGRGGRGSIFAWASGNGGRRMDNCNCDGYTNSPYTLSISSATQNGAKPWYLEECSSTLATTYSSGTPGRDENIVTCDQDETFFRSAARGEDPPNGSKLCTLSHTGTSASAPIAAGVIALALEANPRLSWRDMQHIVVLTSRYEPLRHEAGWVTNGVGRRVSHKFGYGLMDAEAMVRLAERWEEAPRQKLCETEVDAKERLVPRTGSMRAEMRTDGCKGTANEIRYLEHVTVRISVKFRPRGHLKITLISPAGTPTHLLLPRPLDIEETPFTMWPFLTVHLWGEEAQGTWTLVMTNEGDDSSSSIFASSHPPGTLINWSLSFYGTDVKPAGYDLVGKDVLKFVPRRIDAAQANAEEQEAAEIVRHPKNLATQHKNNCTLNGNNGFIDTMTGKCLQDCPRGSFADYSSRTCELCHSECASCFGPSRADCLSCTGGKYFYGYHCVDRCTDTHYADSKLAECLPCAFNCRTCSGSPHACTSCKKFLKLEGGHCVADCVAIQAASDSRSAHDISNQMNGASQCVTCNASCNTCSGPTDSDCTSCREGMRLVAGRCVKLQKCPSAYFEFQQDGYRECRPCHYSCASCTGSSHMECTSCIGTNPNTTHVVQSNEITSASGMCFSCATGDYLTATDPPHCAPCHGTCNTCNGPGPQNCTRCESGLYSFRSYCVPCCSVGHSESSSNAQCCHCDMKGGGGCMQDPIHDINRREMTDFGHMQVLISHSYAVIGVACLSLVFLFVVLFSAFQFSNGLYLPGSVKSRLSNSSKKRGAFSGYSRVIQFDHAEEKLSLTKNLHDASDEDELFTRSNDSGPNQKNVKSHSHRGYDLSHIT